MLETKFAQCRKAMNLTQVQLAEKLEVTQGLISQIEIGMTVPSFELAKKMANFFDIEIGELFDRYKM